MNILFAGSPNSSAKVLDSLSNETGLRIKAVITQPDKRGKRGNKLVESQVAEKAKLLNIQTLFIKSKILMLISIPLTYAFAVSLFLYQRKINKDICKCAQQGYVPVLMKVNSIAIIIVSTLSLLLLVITSSKMINKK